VTENSRVETSAFAFLHTCQRASTVRDMLNIRIVVPTETGIATTAQSKGFLMNGLSQRVLCIRIQNWVRSFSRYVDVATPESGYR
jgi:hypothetical protein